MMKLAYTRSGNPAAPALVFLHGIGMGGWMWHEQTDHFADYDCYNVDLPGHGRSAGIRWESFDAAADLVAAMLPDKAVSLVGMSLGSVVALHLMARCPTRIKRAVLTGAFAEAPPRWMMTIQGGVLSALLPTGFGQRLYARLLQLPADAMPAYTESIRALSIPDFKRIIGQIADYTPLTRLEAVTTPTLLITGEKDVALNRQAVTQLAEKIPGAVGMYAPDVHHGWNGENPPLFNAMTRAWLEAQPLPPALLPAQA